MDDLIEEILAPDVIVRRAPTSEVDIRPGPTDGSEPALVSVAHGAVWVRAEAHTGGVDIGHGSLDVIVREGTVLMDAHAGAGLVIVMRGRVEIIAGGDVPIDAVAGDALMFDGGGQVGEPDPIDASELARDPFVSLNLVLDALGGAPLDLDLRDNGEGLDSDDLDLFPERRRRNPFTRAKR